MEKYQEIERSIIKKYRKEIWSRFIKAIKDYNLIEEGDSIMVCISGGKDSFLLAKCMQEILRHGKVHFDVKYVVMNPGYQDKNLELIKKNAEIMNIPIEIFETDIFEVANYLNEENPCYMCARMRRGHLYNKAQELGCNKIALGHHFDDVIETTLLNIFYGCEVKTMLPKLHSTNFKGIELIRPLYLIKEKDIISWAKNNKLEFLKCECKVEERGIDSKRLEIKKLIENLKKQNKNIDNNIFISMENINLDVVLGYRKDNVKHTFTEEYDKKQTNV